MSYKILVVDDDLPSLQLVKHILKTEGYELAEAQDGLEALDLLQRETPDLIILDYMMPNLDGVELSLRLRNIPDLVNVPVLLVTAFHEGFDHLPVTPLGVDDFLPKPINSRDLLAHVANLLKK